MITQFTDSTLAAKSIANFAGGSSLGSNQGAEPLPTPPKAGLIVNADDWGRDRNTTDRIHDCVKCGTVSATSAMVSMEDSERAAALARECGVDVGLHLNLTTSFSAAGLPSQLLEHQRRVAKYLTRYRLASVVYMPQLASSFEYLIRAQLEEFERLFGAYPARIDGHHHMHLCANVLHRKLLPAGTQVRRNFSFRKDEKSAANRWYRNFVDARLAARHQLVDFFFSLPPLDPPSRLQRVFATARQSVVELETHPVNAEEYRFLTEGEMLAQAGPLLIRGGFAALRPSIAAKHVSS